MPRVRGHAARLGGLFGGGGGDVEDGEGEYEEESMASPNYEELVIRAFRRHGILRRASAQRRHE